MSRRTSEASSAVREAWEKERQLVLNGNGTRDWTQEQQRSIIDKGKAYDENGKAFEGHHMKSAEAHPEYQGEADNIQFLSRSEHQEAHGGSFQNPTNGYYDPRRQETKAFEEEGYEPCPVIELSDPVQNISMDELYNQGDTLGDEQRSEYRMDELYPEKKAPSESTTVENAVTESKGLTVEH